MTKYFTPASDELKSSLENETRIYKDKLASSIETNKDNKLLDEIMNIIPIIEIKITSENSVLSSDLSFCTTKYKKITNPEPVKIIHFKKEPNESKTKKPLKISSKWNISLKIKNCEDNKAINVK